MSLENYLKVSKRALVDTTYKTYEWTKIFSWTYTMWQVVME